MKKLKRELKKSSSKEKAEILQRFFKTGRGEYGAGDIFLGITVPRQRVIAKEFGNDLSFEHIEKLLESKIHEERLVGLLILIERYKKAKADEKGRKFIFDFYLKHAKLDHVNNWDLVDLSAPNIIGDYLVDKKKDRKFLHKLARSKNLWERRIAIVSSFAFIREGDFSDTLKISLILLRDEHDLIQKAVGWMLREVGKRNQDVLERFLRAGGRYKTMPRTMLRYSIERFGEGLRKKYLLGGV